MGRGARHCSVYWLGDASPALHATLSLSPVLSSQTTRNVAAVGATGSVHSSFHVARTGQARAPHCRAHVTVQALPVRLISCRDSPQ